MPFRFFNRTRIAPWVTLNMSRSGPSISVGPPGAKLTFGKRVRTTIGLPGTGAYWTQSYAYQSLGVGRAVARFIIAFVLCLALLVALAALGATVGATFALAFVDANPFLYIWK
jgi:hypothetical protein